MTPTTRATPSGVAEYARVLRVLTDRDKDCYPADRELATRLDACAPDLRAALRSAHRFAGRAVRAATEGGVRQLVAVGVDYPRYDDAGGPDPHAIPAADLGVRTVYLDADPVVLVHARAHHRHPGVRIVAADPTAPDAVRGALADAGFDGGPTAVRLGALLCERLENASHYTRALITALPIGSVLILTHLSADHHRAAAEATATSFADYGLAVTPRTRAEIVALLDGLDPLEPGLTHPHQWRVESRQWAEREYVRGWAPAPEEPSLLYAACAEKRR